ncbi:MAG: PD-(D/E)XK nuclease family protein [Treponema sp.]|nr:PD-(D/E)XK nuclease family protein [Treponema sp.]
MKVFYNPSYDGFVYYDFSKTNIAFDTVVCNTKSLVELIELHAGLHIPVAPDLERTLDYYAAIKNYTKTNPGHLFAKSFERDGINTAKECLKWRDAMLLAGWLPGKNDASDRMKTLAAIEKNFNSPSFGEKLLQVTKAVKNGCNLPENLEIITPFDFHCFQPAEVELLKAIGEDHVHVNSDLPANRNFLRKMAETLKDNKSDKLTLEENDGSVEILEFENTNDSLQYLTQLPVDEYSVWINRDNRAFDSWLNYLNKPTCGSSDKGVSQISELPMIGLGIFSRPLNLTSLISWLSVPLSPLSFRLRDDLVNTIVDQGGYFNDACKTILNDASDSDKEKIKYFLPNITKPEEAISQSQKIKKTAIVEYVAELYKWVFNKTKDEKMNEAQMAQLQGALSTCEAMKKIFGIFDDEEIAFEDLVLVFDSLSTEIEMEISGARKGCQNLIESSANYASPAKTAIWCDFYNPDEGKLTYAFLSPAEKEKLKAGLWQEDNEREYIRLNKYLPLFYTEEKLAFVTVKKCGTEDAVKEPLVIRLEKNMGKDENGKDLIERYIKHMVLADIPGVKTEPLPQVNNRHQGADGTVRFTRADLVKFGEEESFSSISNLIDYPFDYVFDKIIELRKIGAAALDAVYTTKGTVAHAIIEELFSPKHGGRLEDIENQIATRYEEVFNQKVLERGGILLQSENLSEKAVFYKQMKKCVEELLEFIRKNELKVVACEQRYEKVALPEFSARKITFSGSIDMVLENSAGEPVIFDFKFSPKEDKFLDWIKKNRSMQLSLYKGLVNTAYRSKGKTVKAAAYVLLPDVKVITADDLIDAFEIDVDPDRAGNLLIEMSNSYNFRKEEQIKKGIIEDGEGMIFSYNGQLENSSVDYVAKMEDQELVPMDLEIHSRIRTWNKKENKYSDYKTFKAGK